MDNFVTGETGLVNGGGGGDGGGGIASTPLDVDSHSKGATRMPEEVDGAAVASIVSSQQADLRLSLLRGRKPGGGDTGSQETSRSPCQA